VDAPYELAPDRASAAPETPSPPIFLLSPARCSGERAGMLCDPRSKFELARKIQSPHGAPLGDVFSWLSALYFRGKLTYARTFARPPRERDGLLVITPGEGLCAESEPITAERLRALGQVDVHRDNSQYTEPLSRAAEALAQSSGPKARVVLLGSIASAKYVEVLLRIFGPRLLFPADFVGRGDMSRGGLLLRCAREGRELDYVPVLGTKLRGSRPARLPPAPRKR
jgi:hypothetical protein